jgi:glycosyltransferase involved in cell wall biosynthesis
MVDPDITEVVKNGQNGYFAKPNPKDFANKIAKILNNDELRHSMSTKSVEYANGLSLHQQSTKLVNLYESAIDTLGLKKIDTH